MTGSLWFCSKSKSKTLLLDLFRLFSLLARRGIIRLLSLLRFSLLVALATHRCGHHGGANKERQNQSKQLVHSRPSFREFTELKPQVSRHTKVIPGHLTKGDRKLAQ